MLYNTVSRLTTAPFKQSITATAASVAVFLAVVAQAVVPKQAAHAGLTMQRWWQPAALSWA